MENVVFIKKFRFKSFDSHAFEEISSVQYKNYINNLNDLIIGTFFMDDFNSLVVISHAYYEVNNNCDTRRRNGATYSGNNDQGFLPYSDLSQKYILTFYTNNLIPLTFAEDNEFYFNDNLENKFLNDIYFKSIYLKNKNVFFAYISEYRLIFDLYKISYNKGGHRFMGNQFYITIDYLE